MELTVHDGNASLEVADGAFGRPFNEPLVHQAVVACMAGARRGTKAQKSRADVRGGGEKPWRQKGTGRARAGTIRSPLWRHGGVHFAARPRDHTQRLNRKMYRGALRSILSELVRQDKLVVVESLGVAEPKTRQLRERLEALGGTDALVVLAHIDKATALAGRNLAHTAVVGVDEITPVSLLRHERVVMTTDAVRQIEGWLG